jgi:hypothetical protein
LTFNLWLSIFKCWPSYIDPWHFVLSSLLTNIIDWRSRWIYRHLTLDIWLDIVFLFTFNKYYRLEIQMTDSEAFATIGAGFCDQADTSNCVIYIDMLKDAILPLPICHPDGTFDWPKGLYKLNTCLFQTQKLLPRRFGLDRFYCTSI